MVVDTKLMAVVALTLGCAACSAPVGKTKDDPARSEYPAEAVQLARARMQETFVRLEKKIRVCDDDLRATTVVSPQVIPKLPLSEREWGTALAHLSNQATARCEGDVWGEALLAYTRFRDFEKQTTGGNTVDTSPYNLEMLCCIGEFGKLEIELEYRKIAPEIRQQLESIPELNRPFNPIKTFETMQR